jgi:hypothetical protein
MAYVEVEVDLKDFSTEDILAELKSRQLDGFDEFTKNNIKGLVQKIYELKRDGKDYTYQLNTLFYNVIGRI